MKSIPQNVSQAVKKLNPHLYGMGGVCPKEPQPKDVKALVDLAKILGIPLWNEEGFKR